MIDKPTTIEQWEKEYNILDGIIDMKDAIIRDLKQRLSEVESENKKLKEKL